MDEIVTTTPAPETQQPVAAPVAQPIMVLNTPAPHRRRALTIIGIIVALIAIGLIFWFFFYKKNATVSSQDSLQRLQESSQPVSSTTQQRGDTLEALSRRSAQNADVQQRLDKLQSLQ